MSWLEVEATRSPPCGLQKFVEQLRRHRIRAEVACRAPRANEVDKRLQARPLRSTARVVTLARVFLHLAFLFAPRERTPEHAFDCATAQSLIAAPTCPAPTPFHSRVTPARSSVTVARQTAENRTRNEKFFQQREGT